VPSGWQKAGADGAVIDLKDEMGREVQKAFHVNIPPLGFGCIAVTPFGQVRVNPLPLVLDQLLDLLRRQSFRHKDRNRPNRNRESFGGLR